VVITYPVTSDYYKGFVSLDCLKVMDNSLVAGVKLRTKHLTFVSHELILNQIQKQLNLNIAQHNQLEILEIDKMMVVDQESKLSNNRLAADQSEYSSYTNKNKQINQSLVLS
jgi:hypothetical protein